MQALSASSQPMWSGEARARVSPVLARRDSTICVRSLECGFSSILHNLSAVNGSSQSGAVTPGRALPSAPFVGMPRVRLT